MRASRSRGISRFDMLSTKIVAMVASVASLAAFAGVSYLAVVWGVCEGVSLCCGVWVPPGW